MKNIDEFIEAYYHILVAALLLFALLIRLFGLSKGIWLDEAISIEKALSDNFLETMRAYDHPFLYFLLLKAWGYLSLNEAFLRFFSVLLSLGTIFVLIKWIENYSKLSALLAGLLITSLPMMLWFSQEIRHYSLLFLFISFSKKAALKIQRLFGFPPWIWEYSKPICYWHWVANPYYYLKRI